MCTQAHRNFWRYAPKKGSFHLFWAHFGHFGPSAHHYGPSAQTKKMHMTFEDMVKLFYFMTFIPKLHILAARGKKSGFFTIFGTFRPFWRTSLPERKKNYKMKKLRLVDTFLECGLRFFIFSQEGLQNGRRRHLKIACMFDLPVHVCVHVGAHQHF